MKKEVVCLWPVDTEQKAALLKAGGTLCTITFSSAETVTEQQARKAEIILGSINPDFITESENLKWLQLTSAGTDSYVASGKLSPTVKLTNATGAYGQSVAEHMFALMLMLMKNLHLYRDNQNKAIWVDEGTVSTPENARILIVGLGDIGGCFAELCKKFGAETIGVKRHAGPCPEFLDRLYTEDKLDDLLPTADVVLSILPNTKETDGLWNSRKFSRMKQSAIFMNGGRGNAVNQEDLYDVLFNRKIAAAGIDVTVPEPLPPDSKLWSLPNLVITPHAAGSFHLPVTLTRIIEIGRKNLVRYLAGEPLINEVDFSTGYRKYTGK